MSRCHLLLVIALACACTRGDPTTKSAPSVAAASISSCSPTTYPDAPESNPVSAGSRRCPEGMILVQGGTFTLGPFEDSSPAFAMPAHRAFVQTYCIDRAKVSVAAFNQCGSCVATRGFVAGDSTLPARNLRPEEMARYCADKGKRLPTEAEWEHAARQAGARSDMPDLIGTVAELTSTEICGCEGNRCTTASVIRGQTRRMRPATDRTTSDQLGFRCAAALPNP